MNVSPDGLRYLAMSEGRRMLRPFHYRWLLPLVCGPEFAAWQFVSRLALVGLGPAAFWYAGGGWRGLFVAAVPYGLAGVFHFNQYFPILVDAPAMLLAVLCAAAVDDGLWAAGILLAFTAATVKEQAPVFAALFAWHPLPLVALFAVGVRHLMRPGGDVSQLGAYHTWLVEHPFQAGWRSNRKRGWNPAVWLLPWGACLLALTNLDVQVAVTAAAAYATVWVATDCVRLYQWAWPPVAVAAAHAIPPSWLLLVALLHLANPWRGDGV